MANQQPHRGGRSWWSYLNGQLRSGDRMGRPKRLPLGRSRPNLQTGWQAANRTHKRKRGFRVQLWLCLIAIAVLVILALLS